MSMMDWFKYIQVLSCKKKRFLECLYNNKGQWNNGCETGVDTFGNSDLEEGIIN